MTNTLPWSDQNAINLLEQRATEVQSLIGSVRGLVSYILTRTGGEFFTVGAAEQVLRARRPAG